MLHISRGGRWCRLGMLRFTYFEFYRTVCFSFLFFFWIFCLTGPKKSALDTFGNCRSCFSTCGDTYMYFISIPWFTLPPAFWFKIAKTRETDVDVVTNQGYLVMLLEDLKWFANMWTGNMILPQFQKIDCNPLILSPVEFCGLLL